MSAAAAEELSSKSVDFDMTRYQLLLFPGLAATILAIGGALNLKPSGSVATAASAVTNAAPRSGVKAQDGAKALAILDSAIAALAADKVNWLETKVWQQVTCEEFSYQASGRLVTGPAGRVRYDLHVKVGKTVGKLRLVNDGKAIWQSVQTGSEAAVVQSWPIPILSDTLKTPEQVAQARVRLLEEHGVDGPSPMLRKFRQRLQNAEVRPQLWNSHDVHVVTAAWPAEDAALAALPDFARPRFQLSQCCIYLDAQSHWPHRIEWWGVARPGKPSQLVAQTEFREPVLNQPMSAERCAGEFTFVAH
jgi:hypothetical protein